MSTLTCDIDDQFTVKIEVDNEVEAEGNSTDSDAVVILRLLNRDDDKHVIATKKISWPEITQLPAEVSYDSLNSVVCLKSTTTKVEIPLKLRAVRQVGYRKETATVKKYKTFSADVFPAANTQGAILAAITKFAEEYKTDPSTWNGLSAAFPRETVSLAGCVSHFIQAELIKGLKEFKGKKNANAVHEKLYTSNVFGFKFMTEFFDLLMENKETTLIMKVLNSTPAFPEGTYARVLQLAASEEQKEEGKKLLLNLLKRSFTENLLIEQLGLLSTAQAAQLIEWLTEIYEDEENKEHFTRTLSLLGALLDSHGHRLVWDDSTHEKVLASAGLLADMAALADAFSSIESVRTVPDAYKSIVPKEKSTFSLTKPKFLKCPNLIHVDTIQPIAVENMDSDTEC